MPEGTVIIDSGPLVAFLVEEDVHHSWAVAQFRELPAPFLTCEPVLTETFHLVHRLKRGKEKFLDLLGSGVLDVDFALMAQKKALAKLVLKYADIPMSLADACMVRMAELSARASVFTVDGGFLVYRKHGRQVIPTVMPPGTSRRR